jgi:hypothetical protein
VVSVTYCTEKGSEANRVYSNRVIDR